MIQDEYEGWGALLPTMPAPADLPARIREAGRSAIRRDLSGGTWLIGMALGLAGLFGAGAMIAAWSSAALSAAHLISAAYVEAVAILNALSSPRLFVSPLQPLAIMILGIMLAWMTLRRGRNHAAGRGVAMVCLLGLSLAAMPIAAMAEETAPVVAEAPATVAPPAQDSQDPDEGTREMAGLLLVLAAYFLGAVLAALGLAGTSGLVLALTPDLTRFAGGGLISRPAASLGMGTAQLALFFLLAAGCEFLGETVGGIVGITLFSAEAILLTWGMAICATSVGARLLETAGKSGDPRAEVLWGSGMIGLSLLLPIVGWVVAVVLWLAGTGAALGSICRIKVYRPQVL